MKNIFVINKKEGETPLEALDKFKKKNQKYNNTKMTYAGRLDPMASGLLLVLAGEETKNKEKYLSLDKEYEFEVLFSFATDTFDILGKVVSSDNSAGKDLTEVEFKKSIKNNLKYFTGKFIQQYPIYSSKTVKGKQLFEYARAGLNVEVPSRSVYVKSLKLIKLRNISSRKLLANVEKRILKVNGDFRQKEILTIWNKYLNVGTHDYTIASFKIKCSSGTYVRGIADNLGKRIGIPALAFSIKRTKIGKWSK
ncbi:MAG: hypothetical protein KGL67_01290 [Patescibacteria group bacterium]|nr:hypothetical protein [Patescibacteria group bacterium]